MKNHYARYRSQQGGALLIFVLILVLAGTAALFSSLDGSDVKLERDRKTVAALSEAKAALIGFAVKSGTAVGAARPGDLPCPDIIGNDGQSDPCAANAIGRLPWRTLGISELRDGDNEQLWYAVSNNFKNNPRIFPLNSDTIGTITIRDTAGNLINDGAANNGVAAVVISPGAVITRQDGVNQVRDNANLNTPMHYLDIALGEDNQNYVNGNANGLIEGPIKDVNGSVVLNDKLLSITQAEILVPVEKRVVAAVSNALLDFFCSPDVADYTTKNCSGVAGNQFYPRPALFSDTTCFGLGNAGACISDLVANRGRLPATLTIGAWDATSILRGTSASNWFQSNGWREHIHYAVDLACVEGTVDCGGGLGIVLTLNNALANPISRIVVTAAGRAQAGQDRLLNFDKQNEINYLEDENVLPLDDVFTRTVAAAIVFNDISVNISQ